MAMCLQNSLHLSWIKRVINSYGPCRNSWLPPTPSSPDASNPRQQRKNMHVMNLQTGKWWEQAEWSVVKFLSSHVKWSHCLLKPRTQVPASGGFSVCFAIWLSCVSLLWSSHVTYFSHPLKALACSSQKSDQSALIWSSDVFLLVLMITIQKHRPL